MKIRSLKFDNNPILGSLELDFTAPNNEAYDTILLVGENGAGKSTILSNIADFLCGNFIKGIFSEFEYTIDNQIYSMKPRQGGVPASFIRSNDDGTSVNLDQGGNYNVEQMRNDELDPRHYGVVFSKPRADFKTNQIRTVTTSDLDQEINNQDKSEEYTSLKQLLVDVDALDHEEFARLHRNGNAISYEDFMNSHSRCNRFVKAFNNFFDNIKFKEIRNVGNAKEIIFEKNGKEILIDNLSTGEKQIVYRGTFILKNLKKLEGGVVLIDEPELSLHPRWQDKILTYYQTLFSNPTTGEQTSQLIIATHSERILTNAFEDARNGRNNLVIILKDNHGIIESEKIEIPGVLNSVTAAETIYLAYKIPTVDYHIELFAALQTKYGGTNVAETDRRIIAGGLPYNPMIHNKQWHYNGTTYNSLPAYVRNAIDHPDPNQPYTKDELKTSIDLMRELLLLP